MSDEIRAALDAAGDLDDVPADPFEETAAEFDDAADPTDALDDDGGLGVLDWARRIPEGSHFDFDARDWWDPDGGGENRLAFHLSDASGDGLGYPNGVGVLVALAELYVAHLTGQSDGSDGGDMYE